MTRRRSLVLTLGGVALLTAIAVLGTHFLRLRSKDAAVEGCIAAIQSASQTPDPYERGARVASACGALHAEKGCRDAYTLAWAKDTDPSQRVRIMAEGCRDAYCPILSGPKPALCDQAEPNLMTARTTWPEFERVVLVRDLGPERAERVAAARRAAARGNEADRSR